MSGGHSMFCFLCFFISMFCPGMVLNQGQLSIVVSDWEPYLGSPFPPSMWDLVLCLCAGSLHNKAVRSLVSLLFSFFLKLKLIIIILFFFHLYLTR